MWASSMTLAVNLREVVGSGDFLHHYFPGFHLAYLCVLPLDTSGLANLFTILENDRGLV